MGKTARKLSVINTQMWNKNTQDATKNLSRKYDYILGEVSAPDLYTKIPKVTLNMDQKCLMMKFSGTTA